MYNTNDKCLIYLLTCNKCMFQYIGKTVNEFRLRWNNDKMNNRNILKGQTCMQQQLFEHFANEGHCSFLEDVTIKFINKSDPKDPNRREHYWRHAQWQCLFLKFFRTVCCIRFWPLVLALKVLNNDLYLHLYSYTSNMEVDLRPYHASEMVLLANMASSFYSFTTLAEISILDAWNGSEYAFILDSFKTIYYYLFLYLNWYLVIWNYVQK